MSRCGGCLTKDSPGPIVWVLWGRFMPFPTRGEGKASENELLHLPCKTPFGMAMKNNPPGLPQNPIAGSHLSFFPCRTPADLRIGPNHSSSPRSALLSDCCRCPPCHWFSWPKSGHFFIG